MERASRLGDSPFQAAPEAEMRPAGLARPMESEGEGGRGEARERPRGILDLEASAGSGEAGIAKLFQGEKLPGKTVWSGAEVAPGPGAGTSGFSAHWAVMPGSR